MSRNTLHKSKLDDFKAWLLQNGFEIRRGIGEYQVMQLGKPGQMFYGIYLKQNAIEHYSVDSRIDKIVWRFLNETRRSKAKSRQASFTVRSEELSADDRLESELRKEQAEAATSRISLT